MTSRPSVVVVGGGTMGAGIARCLLDAGATVVVAELSEHAAQLARTRIGTDAEVHTQLPTEIDAALVIEAVPEHVDLKSNLLAQLDVAFPGAELIATNTSSLSIDRLAKAVTRPDRFLGMHFFNPVPKSGLVELVVGAATSASTVAAARRWVDRLGKESIEVRDSPGFATSRLGIAIGLEAMRMVEEGVASVDDIDRGMVLGYRYPVGPLRLTDLVGLDVRLAIAEHLADELGPRFDPPALLRAKVAAGELGKKTGQGFYAW